MGPYLFAIFVVCTPNLIHCADRVHETTLFVDNDLEVCQKYVKHEEELALNNSVVMGSCVLRMIIPEEDEE